MFADSFGFGGGGFFNAGCCTTAGAVCAASKPFVGGYIPSGSGGAAFFGFGLAFSCGGAELPQSMAGGGFFMMHCPGGFEEGSGGPSVGATFHRARLSTPCRVTGFACEPLGDSWTEASSPICIAMRSSASALVSVILIGKVTGFAFSAGGEGGGGLARRVPSSFGGSCRTCALLVEGDAPFDPIGCARSRLLDL